MHKFVTLTYLSVNCEKASAALHERFYSSYSLDGSAARSSETFRRGWNAVQIRTRQAKDARFRQNDLQFRENFSDYCRQLDRRPSLSRIIRDAPRQVWRWIFLAEVRVQEGEPLENALRRFKRKVQQEDIIKEVKRHSYYLKPGEKKRVKAALARKRNRKKARKEAD
jgi:small subunit ribosomal protein S21